MFTHISNNPDCHCVHMCNNNNWLSPEWCGVLSTELGLQVKYVPQNFLHEPSLGQCMGAAVSIQDLTPKLDSCQKAAPPPPPLAPLPLSHKPTLQSLACA